MKNEIFSRWRHHAALPGRPGGRADRRRRGGGGRRARQRVLGSATADFCRAVARTRSGPPSFPENRGGESTLGNFVADVQLLGAHAGRHARVEIAFMNPGGLRADLGVGRRHLPRGGQRAAVRQHAGDDDLTGAQLKQVLEQQWQPAGAQRPFLKLGVSRVQVHLRPDGAGGIADHRDVPERDPSTRPAIVHRSARTRSSRRVATTSSPSRRARTRPTAARSTSRRWSTTSRQPGTRLARLRAARGRRATSRRRRRLQRRRLR